MHDFDPFRDQKEEAYFTALPIITQMGEYLLKLISNKKEPIESGFIQLLKVSFRVVNLCLYMGTIL